MLKRTKPMTEQGPCWNCGSHVEPNAEVCFRCGVELNNTSGLGKAAGITKEISGWNWGAFLLNWIWGLGNKTPIALLSLVPYIGLIWLVVLGVKGNEWAWRNKRWASIEQFKATQKKWAIWGIVLFVFGLLFYAWWGYIIANIGNGSLLAPFFQRPLSV